jgi:hypothetical protein
MRYFMVPLDSLRKTSTTPRTEDWEGDEPDELKMSWSSVLVEEQPNAT